MKFRFDGAEYDLIERPLFAEFSWVERQAGYGADDLTSTEKQAALYLISLRRAAVHLTWADVQQMSPAEFVPFDDPEVPAVEAVDPPAAGGEAGEAETPSMISETATGF